MSVRIMSKVFDLPDMGPTKRLIMLALADHADDAGRCYPSIDRLAKRTGLSERAVRTNLRQLEVEGYLATEIGVGPQGCNVYFVRPIPAGDAPRQEMPPGRRFRGGGHMVPLAPAGDAPKPSGTIKETSENINARAKPKRKTQIPEDAVLSEKMESIARNEGISQQEAEAQFDRFKGYCIANAKTYASWDAAWRNWLRSPFFKPITTGGHHGKPSRTNSTADAISLAARMRRSPGANRG